MPTCTARASSPGLPTRYSPEKVVAWTQARRRQRALLRRPVSSTCSAFRSSRPGRTGSRSSTNSSERNLAEVRKFPITPHRNLGRERDRLDFAHVLRRGDRHASTARFRYPGVVEHVGALNTRDGSMRRLADIKRAMLYRVASFAYDPASGTAFYTNDNLALRDLMAVDVKTGEERMLLEDARIGEIVFNPVDRSLMGVRHENGLATLVRIPLPYDEWYRVHAFPYGVVPYDLDISPDGRLLSASVSEVNGDQFLRVWELDEASGRRRQAAVASSASGSRSRRASCFRETGATCTAAATTRACPTSSATRSPPATIEAVSNAETGFFRPVPLADGRLVVLTYTAEGFVPAIDRAAPDRGRERDHVPGRRGRGEVSRGQDLAGAAAEHGRRRKADHGKGPYMPLRDLALANAYPVLQGYKNYGGHRLPRQHRGSARLREASASPRPTRRAATCRRTSAATSTSPAATSAGVALSWNRSDFYDLFGPTKRSRKGYAAKLGYD